MTETVSAAPGYPKVLAVSGRAEILHPESGWQKLEAAASLKKGFKIRTEENSFVEISWDEKLESMARLDENARLDILGQDSRSLFLVKGSLMILREENTPADRQKINLPIKVFTEDALVQIGEGGCSVRASSRETRVKVFSEKVRIFPLKNHRIEPDEKTVTEGFKIDSGKAVLHPFSHFHRMGYADYKDWQAWVRRSYERKDDVAAEAFQEGARL